MDLDYLTLCQIKNGDEKAAERFVRKYYPEILRYCYLHIADYGDAEDLTQETFARFFGSLNRYQYQGRTRNYLYTIASNLCRDYYKRQKDIPMEELPELPIESMYQVEARLDVCAMLTRLPGELRQVVILYFYRSRSQTEIARILGISQPLVQRRLSRAKKMLRELMEKEV